MSLSALLDGATAGPAEIREALDVLSDGQRLDVCLTLRPAQQRRLWQVASAGVPAASAELVGAGTAVFAGRNSLRLFSRFEKWFVRLDEQIVGCNRHALSALIGPGYFTVREGGSGSDAMEFDYGQVPAQTPSGWQPVRDNARGLARQVYGDLLDRVTWVAPNVLVGAAFRSGAALDSYFVLVRQTA